MSYYCGIPEATDFLNLPIELKQDLLNIYKEQEVGFEDNLSDEEIATWNLNLSYIDDPTGAIYDWATKHKLTFSFFFEGEDDVEYELEYINGKRFG